MSLTRKTIVDQIMIDRNGAIHVRYGLQIFDGSTEIDCKWHRTVFQPGTDVDVQTAAVNADLQQRNLSAPIPFVETDKIKGYADLAWTPDVVAAAQARRKAQI